MAHYKVREQILQRLTHTDQEALLSICLHRCLSAPLLYQRFYSTIDIRQSYAGERIQELIALRLLEEKDYGQSFPALFLSSLGVETVKSLYSPKIRNLYRTGGERLSLPRASDLKMHTKMINHQMHLNSFALEFESYTGGDLFYYDEKFMPPASEFMMPDGMIELPDRYLFLEMDMGTENTTRLAQKWNSYRIFLNSPSTFYQDKPVVMLFIIDGVKKAAVRAKNIISSLLGYLAGRINGTFEVYVNEPAALHQIIQTQMLGWETDEAGRAASILQNLYQSHRFLLSRPAFLSKMEAPYGYYIRKLNERGRIQIVDGCPQEFLMDLWLDGRVSVIRNLLYSDHSKRQSRILTGRVLPYLLILPSEKWAFDILQAADIPQPKEVYFTTPARLSTCIWQKALFRIDPLGNLSHYADISLKTLVHERRLAKKTAGAVPLEGGAFRA